MARDPVTRTWRSLRAPTLLAIAVLSVSTALAATSSMPSTSNTGNSFSTESGCTQGVVAMEPVADATIKAGEPNANFGAAGTLEVAAIVAGPNRSLVRFDLPTIEPGCLLLSAQLALTVNSGDPLRPIGAYQLSEAWDENAVTWGTRPAVTPTVAGGVSAAGTTTIDVLVLVVAQYVAGGHHGMEILDSQEAAAATNPGSNSFFSRETVGSAPVLTLTFVNL